MEKKEYFEIRLESIGGLGANLCGKLLGELGASYLNLNASSFSSYGSEKRGSPVTAHIRWCPKGKKLRLCTPVQNPDLLAIFHEALLAHGDFLSGISQTSILLLHTELSPEAAAKKYHITKGQLFCIPALSIALAEKSRLNMVMLGAITAALGDIPLDYALSLCEQSVGKKYPQYLEANKCGIQKGYDAIRVQTPFVCHENLGLPPVAATNTSSFEWGYKNAPIGGINPLIGSTLTNDLSASREGYLPLFYKERCIHCGLCESTCPDYVFTFLNGVNEGPNYTYCKGCLRCVEICPTNALIRAFEKDFTVPSAPHGANAFITGEAHFSEQQIDGGMQ